MKKMMINVLENMVLEAPREPIWIHAFNLACVSIAMTTLAIKGLDAVAILLSPLLVFSFFTIYVLEKSIRAEIDFYKTQLQALAGFVKPSSSDKGFKN